MRARWWIATLAVVSVGCSVVLGIDGNIIDPPPPDAAPKDVPQITLDQSSISLRQGSAATVHLTVKSNAGRLVAVTLKGLPAGVTTLPLSLTEGNTAPITLTADDLARRGDYHVTIEGNAGDLAAAPLALDVHVDGNLDTTFGDGGVVLVPFGPTLGAADGEPIGLAIDAQNRILIAYGAGGPGVSLRPIVVVRLDADGKLDPTFGDAGVTAASVDGGPTPNQRAQAIALMPDGTIVVAGRSAELAATTQGVVAVFDPNGAFVGGQKVDAGDSTIYSAIAVESQQTVIALAQADSYGILTRVSVLDGTIDPTYGDAGISTAEPKNKSATTCHDVDIAGGRALVSCRTNTNLFTVLAVLPDGGLDTSFGTAGGAPSPAITGTTQEPFASVLADDRIVQVGVQRITSLAAPDRVEVRVLSAIGAPDPTFGDGGIATYEPQREGTSGAEAFAALVADGGLVVGGALEISGDRRTLVMRLDLDAGAMDTTFGSNGVSSIAWPSNAIAVRRLALQGDRVIAAAVARRPTGGTQTVDVVLVRYLP